jgi:predicted extracellular nuclease
MRSLIPCISLFCCVVFGASAATLPISKIQGTAHTSPFNGKEVTTQGVVTRVYKDGFIIESKTPDASPATSEALYVYEKETEVQLDNELRVSGKVEEYIPGGEGSHNLGLTQIRADKVEKIKSKATLPKPIVLNYLLPNFPEVIKQPGSSFDPAKYAMDFWESMEHMRVVILNSTVVGPSTEYGEIAVSVPEAALEPTTNRGGVKLTGYTSNPPKVLVALDPENPNHYSVGDRIGETIFGTVNYSYGNYKVGSSKPISKPASLWIAKPPLLPPIPDSALKIATFNVENLYQALPDEKFSTLAKTIVDALQSPDIIGLQEIHDNSGPENDGTVDAGEVLIKLINFIEEAGGPSYAFHQLSPENNADGGWPGANIRNAFLYRKESIQLGQSYLLQNKAFDEDDEKDFSGTRKPLVAFFRHGDERLIVINCHLRSKGGDTSAYGALMPAIRFSERQRILQTRAIREHANLLKEKYPQAEIVVLGDMNDYEFSPAIEELTKGFGLVNLVERVPLEERYNYVFQGFSQILDHILVTPELAQKAHARIAHVNADLAEGLRASDHDPILVWIK